MSKKLLSLLFTCLIGVSAVSCSSPVTRKQIVPEARAVKHYTGFFAALKDDCSESERIRSIIADKTGAVCEEKWLTKNDNRDDVISIMINKGDYPDFIYAGTDHSKFLEAGWAARRPEGERHNHNVAKHAESAWSSSTRI